MPAALHLSIPTPAERDFALDAYDFDLPSHLIAQEPAEVRDQSRLMVVDRQSGQLEHKRFHQLAELLSPGDLLVLNDTRVVAGRLYGQRASGGKVELLLIKALEPECMENGLHIQRWYSIGKPAARFRVETAIQLGEQLLAWPEERVGEGWRLRLEAPEAILTTLERVGHLPLPPYIQRQGQEDIRCETDRQRYQTVFAQSPGSAAAPTAGLHFTEALLKTLVVRGIELATLTLHVGTGTFAPVRSADIRAHQLHSESWQLSAAAAQQIRAALVEGRRVVAVGTTVVRTLEAASDQLLAGIAGYPSALQPARPVASVGLDGLQGETRIFIYPGHSFRVVGAMVTNFHLPRSSLLMLVSAFAGREQMLHAYTTAIEQGYRFFSYGDAMLIQ